MKIIDIIYGFFDRLEDHVRASLSRHPFIYTFIGGAGVVLFWRGVWHTADLLESNGGITSIIFSSIGSIILGIIILLGTGLFVSVFIGESIIMSGIKKDKKVIDKTIEEVEEEKLNVQSTLDMVRELKEEVESLEKEAHEHLIK
ncbi:TPA: hypothetical protein DEP94_02925 [Candidatus Nomurabacteria bacterium]|nr:hypothetical protein [Candidatus Nomurabacteria bacterium]